MTDDDDRTQEIRRDHDGGPGATDGPSQPSGNTPPFGAPSAPPQRPAGGYGQPAAGYRPQQPVTGYRPAPGYGAPMLPTDRGSGGFPAALVGAVIAALVAVGTSYAGHQAAVHSVSLDPRQVSGFFVSRLGLLPWPVGQGGDRLTAFLAGLVVILLITLLLMMAAAMSTRAGNGGFGLFLGAWMAVVIAGAAAGAVAAAIWMPGGQLSQYIANYITGGMLWGVLYGWIAALALLIAHALRRKPVTR